MGDDKSVKATEAAAVIDAQKKSANSAVTYIQAETEVDDAVLKKDLVNAYSNAQVRVIEELEKVWYEEKGLGRCYRVKLKVEVIPDEKALARIGNANKEAMESDPSAPLAVKLWTDRKEYRQGERIRIFFKGNKPFFGRLIYRDAKGDLVQLLPNPYREDNYFLGGSVYEIPSGKDRFDLEISPPFGMEGITLYASTAPQGDVKVVPDGDVFDVKANPADIPINTRSIKIVPHGGSGSRPAAAEFSEAAAELRTRQPAPNANGN